MVVRLDFNDIYYIFEMAAELELQEGIKEHALITLKKLYDYCDDDQKNYLNRECGTLVARMINVTSGTGR